MKTLDTSIAKPISYVSKETPCIHCGKPDWCYYFSNGASVCNRGSLHLDYEESGYKDKNGVSILYPKIWALKPPEPKVISTQEWLYKDRNGKPLIKVIRYNFDNGDKDIRQNFWNGKTWVKKTPKSLERADKPIYKYQEIREAISKGETIYIVEGEKCADILWSLGLKATTNIGGSKNFALSDVKDLDGAKRVVLVPDRDKNGVALMAQWKEAIPQAEYLYPYPSKNWATVPDAHGLDIDEWIKECHLTAKDIETSIGKIPESLQPSKTTSKEPEEKPYKPIARYKGTKALNSKELLDFVEYEIGDRLSYDELRCEIHLDGELLEIGSDIEFWFLREFGESAPENKIFNAIVNVAKLNRFNPVRDYLTKCKESTAIAIDNLATRYFNRPEPIYNRMLELWLISAVARAMSPGCQADSALVLQGGQGKGKTTWFNTLFGEFFTNSINKNNFGTANSIMTCHTVWGVELGEVDQITASKEAGLIKTFITTREDYLRKPYAREIGRQKRSSIFCATVNPSRFLVDDENRRFWPIPVDAVEGQLDIELLQKERNGIWHSALVAFESGAVWWPTEEEKAAIRAVTGEFEDIDVWADVIEGYISNRSEVSILQILTDCLGFEEKECNKLHQRRVGKILTRLGWDKDARRVKDGKTIRVRVAPEKDVNNSSGNNGNNGKPITNQEFPDYQIDNNPVDNGRPSGRVDSTINDNGLPDKTPYMVEPQSHAQQAVYHDYQIKQVSEQKNLEENQPEFKWVSVGSQPLKAGTLVRTNDEENYWLEQKLVVGWLAMHPETLEKIELSDNQIGWVAVN